MNQVQRAKDRCVNNNQDEYRNHNATRPRFLRGESVSDERHKDSDDRHERRSDVQPFGARDVLATHDVWTNIENREQDRQVHANGGQSCKPNENSNQEWNFAIHRNQRFVAAISDRRKQSVGRMSNI